MQNQQTAFTIEKGIPVPPCGSGRIRAKSKYPFDQMEVGDSLFLPGRTVRDVTGLLWHHKRRNGSGTTWTTRTLTENGVKGARVWRVS